MRILQFYRSSVDAPKRYVGNSESLPLRSTSDDFQEDDFQELKIEKLKMSVRATH